MYKSISELAQINPGNSLPSGVQPMDDVSFIPMSDVSESGEWTGRQVRSLRSVSSGFTSFSDNDVLVAKITPCFENGKGTHVTNLVNGAGFGSTEFHVLRAYPGVSPRFIHHVSQSAQLRRAGEAHMVGSAGQKRVPREFFDVFKVPDFSHDEQIKISHVLDTLDTTIRQTEAIIEKLKQVKQGLLHDLLTRGIDANGELRPPQSEAPELYKDSALGWIPREWSVFGLAQIAPNSRSVIRTGPFGSSLKGEHWREGGRPVITIGSLGDGFFVKNELLFIDESTATRLSDFELVPGDIVFSRVADVGRSVVVTKDETGWIMSSNFMRISVDSEKVRPYFLQLLLASSALVRKQIRSAVNSGGRDVANSAVLMSLVFPWPIAKEQDKIIDKVRSLDKRIKAEEELLLKQIINKSGLMDDLLTGRVRVTPLLESAAA